LAETNKIVREQSIEVKAINKTLSDEVTNLTQKLRNERDRNDEFVQTEHELKQKIKE
jgi:hypothetical protein